MKITIEQAKTALDNLDDYARMDVGVNAMGPRGVLKRFIEEAASVDAQEPVEQQWREKYSHGLWSSWRNFSSSDEYLGTANTKKDNPDCETRKLYAGPKVGVQAQLSDGAIIGIYMIWRHAESNNGFIGLCRAIIDAQVAL